MSVAITLNLDDHTLATLDHLARERDAPRDAVVAEALFLLFDAQAQGPLSEPLTDQQRADIEEGLAQASRGETVPHEEVRRWIETWGTKNERPRPSWK